MANILDYVEWRGDLTFTKSKFNNVDAVVFSQIIFIDMTGIVPARGKISIEDCAKKYFSNSEKSKHLGLIIPPKINDLFLLMSKSKRYSSLVLSNYKKDIDNTTETQFSALTIYIQMTKDKRSKIPITKNKTLLKFVSF